jgi:hypothetical protein
MKFADRRSLVIEWNGAVLRARRNDREIAVCSHGPPTERKKKKGAPVSTPFPASVLHFVYDTSFTTLRLQQFVYRFCGNESRPTSIL